MKLRFCLLLSFAIFFSFKCFSQVKLPVPANLQATYTKGTRTLNGAPGKNYWQNRADYTLKISFDPQSRLLSGTVAIDYTNNSPDTLSEVNFKLYPNLYKKGSVRNMPVLPQDIGDGVYIQQLSINREQQSENRWKIDGTNMTLKTPVILPKQTIHFDITYSYILNKT